MVSEQFVILREMNPWAEACAYKQGPQLSVPDD